MIVVVGAGVGARGPELYGGGAHEALPRQPDCFQRPQPGEGKLFPSVGHSSCIVNIYMVFFVLVNLFKLFEKKDCFCKYYIFLKTLKWLCWSFNVCKLKRQVWKAFGLPQKKFLDS